MTFACLTVTVLLSLLRRLFDSRNTFVQVAGESEVKAQIRLLFNDIHGQKCVAVRSLIATQKVC